MITQLTCSVVIPAYNAARYIRESIVSLLQQTRQPEEILVVDNGSTDETSEIVREFGASVTLLNEKRKGAAFARNLGIKEARGDAIAFLDADDVSVKNRIEMQLRTLSDSPEAAMVFGAMAYADANMRLSGSLLRCEDFKDCGFFGQLLERNQIGSTSVAMARKSILLEAGGFDCSITHNEEYDLWLRLAAINRIKYIDNVMVYYRVHGSNISLDQEAQRSNERRALQKHSLDTIRRALKEAYPDNPYRQKMALARILMRLENLSAAIDLLKEIQTDRQKESDAAFLLGVCHHKNGTTDAAENSYRSCLDLNQSQAEAYNNLGVLAAVAGDFEKAQDYFKTARNLREDYADPIRNLHAIQKPKYCSQDLKITLNTLRKHLKPI